MTTHKTGERYKKIDGPQGPKLEDSRLERMSTTKDKLFRETKVDLTIEVQ